MAWPDFTRDMALRRVRSMIDKDIGVRAAIREIAKDEGIPYSTLRRWHYESVPKNENTRKGGNNGK